MPGFEADFDSVLERARQSGVERILVPGIDLATSRRAVELAEAHDELFAAVGIHPHHAEQATDESLRQIEILARSPKVLAIGEIGLDYHRESETAGQQASALKAQLDIASRLRLPVVLHSRDALAPLLTMLRAWAQDLPPVLQDRCGVLHAFSGDLPAAAQATQAGFFLGAGGPVTYPSAKGLRATLSQVGLDRLLTETDAPYLAPQAHRGQRNEPAYVRYVATAIGELTDQPLGVVAEALRANASRLFDWEYGNHNPRVC